MRETERPHRPNYGLDALVHLLADRDLGELLTLLRLVERRLVQQHLYGTPSVQQRISHIIAEANKRDEDEARYATDEAYRRRQLDAQVFFLSAADRQFVRSRIDACVIDEFSEGGGI